ncbi:MAG: amino acid racemase [Verrucomicrobia bacterium]|nr:amino acid racemase [Verrucomicrobiota bacterium]
MKEIVGILGGMGPLASAEFLKTLYEFNMRDKEQTSPHCILYSDPSIPDRTEAILSGQTNEVFKHILHGLEVLEKLGAAHFILTCISAHYFLSEFPAKIRESIISLVEVSLKEANAFPGRCLLLATTGTIQAEIFQKHPLWPELGGKLLLPNDEDQEKIHQHIYKQIKLNRGTINESLLQALKEKYEVDAFVAGCTEFHMSNKTLLASENPSLRFIDPLYTIGRELPSLMRPGMSEQS